MRLEQSRLAKADLESIFEYGLLHFGIDRVLAYLDHIEGRFQQLLTYPRSGRIEQDLSGTLYSTSCEAHRIYYELTDNTVVIVRVLHKSMDASRWIG
ncbi:type II toxin-antitoxin system RelE/ParE family toxin [Novosphingobium sp. 17-62-19]|uniref:type II toxin-antitoxin system RelE/ParE family toxin n=1 Tax=Novosphingobium sp. 17-62-19 TaxID=1970406 RepID=UPI0025D5F096|nr:type II toxin-antitoxin system RelE/ParE family toxin [Novosphingobium sp. 17-62-19]HQS98569.1 type II toxin-antitoxin system RelE/ParE family toxin [Novosphingobium sp.]